MIKRFIFCFLLITKLIYGQNHQILYDFGDLPQTLLLNPGAAVHNKFHIGVPLLTFTSVSGGFSGFSVYDLFADDGSDINARLRNLVKEYGKTEFFIASQHFDILNVGYRLPNSSYISFGYYQEMNAIGKIPRDLVDLYFDGNSDLNRKYSIDKLGAQADLTGVFHFGYSKQIRRNIQAGIRLKLYSGAIDIKSTKNSGYTQTQLGTDNIYIQRLNDVSFLGQSAGLYLPPGEEADYEYFKKKLLLGGNLGLGIDIGFSYRIKKQWMLTASLLDIGFVKNKNDVRSREIQGDFEIEGFQFYFNPNNPEDYWESISNEFEAEILSEELYDAYTTLRPIKFNSSLSYSFGQTLDACRFLVNPDLYNNKIGGHLFSYISPVHTYVAATLFYEKRFTPFLQAKVTYTADPFSLANIGFGLSVQSGPVNMYFTAENLLKTNNLYNANSLGFTFGMNLIFNGKK